MRPVRLLALYPSQLNLNGDVANREVLAAYLGWQNVPVELIDLRPSENASQLSPDFVIIGHGSIAAWSSIRADFGDLKPQIEAWMNDRVPMLAVASGRDALLQAGAQTPMHLPSLGVVPETFATAANISKFEVATDPDIAAGAEILGYLNTAVTAPVLSKQGSLVLTSLHGPVLSKNLEWLHELATAVAQRADHKLPPLDEALKVNQAAKLGDLIAKIRDLEIDLASQ